MAHSEADELHAAWADQGYPELGRTLADEMRTAIDRGSLIDVIEIIAGLRTERAGYELMLITDRTTA